MIVLCPNPCYNKVCYEGTALHLPAIIYSNHFVKPKECLHCMELVYHSGCLEQFLPSATISTHRSKTY